MQRKNVAGAVVVGLVGILACGKNAVEPTSPEPAVTPSAIATAASATPSATPAVTASSPPAAPAVSTATPGGAPRAIPRLETACATDADCALTDEELVDSPPQTYACCAGCTNHAGNKAWKKKFDAACLATPAPMCPPIGCAMPNQKPVCVAQKCTLK